MVIICLFTKIVCQVTTDKRDCIRVRITKPHHTVDKNVVHLRITTFYCIKLKYYISQLFLVKIFDHVMQINSKIIKSFYP